MLEPEAIAMYCLPPAVYVIGDAFQFWLVWKCHRDFPVLASTAAKAPLSSPKKTTPPAVDSPPPHVEPGPVCGTSQTILPVSISSARRTFSRDSPGALRVPPP